MTMMLYTTDYRHKKFDAHRSSTTSPTQEEPTLSLHRLDIPYSAFSTDSNCSMEFEAFQQRKRRGLQRDTSTPLLKRCKLELTSSELDSGIAFSPQKLVTDLTLNMSTASSSSSAHFADLPTSSVLPRISDVTLRDICKYHGNMVRKFPKKERTPKDQERRNKNTIACRMSRRVKKLEHVAIEEQYKEYTAQHFQIVEKSMRAAAYFNYLSQLIKVTGASSAPLPSSTTALTTSKTTMVNRFSIDYIMGVE